MEEHPIIYTVGHSNHPIDFFIELIQEYRLKPTFGLLGAERINVLELNLALDQIKE